MTGRLTQVDEAYSRNEPVPWPVLLAVLLTAALAQVVISAVAAVLRSGARGGAGRGLKELRNGPEYAVTPVWLRTPDGRTVELEVHGYLRPDALRPRDRVRAMVRAQRRGDLPPRAHRVDNFTSGRSLHPHPPTRWTHLGAPLLLRAALGTALAGLLAGLVTAVTVGAPA